MGKIFLLIANIVHLIFDKKELNKVRFLLNEGWESHQWKERDLIISQGYTLLEHSWEEFGNHSEYIYGKEVKSTKYYDLVVNFFKLK